MNNNEKNQFNQASVQMIGRINSSQDGVVVNPEGIAPTHTAGHGNTQKVAVAMRGRYSEGGTIEQNIEVSNREYANAITTVQKDSLVAEKTKEPSLRIRKLTPKECWRLMGFDDEDFYKAEAVNSNTQLYKQAGNSIVVDVIEAIYGQLFDGCLNGDE